jgi:hypothetical protein
MTEIGIGFILGAVLASVIYWLALLSVIKGAELTYKAWEKSTTPENESNEPTEQ